MFYKGSRLPFGPKIPPESPRSGGTQGGGFWVRKRATNPVEKSALFPGNSGDIPSLFRTSPVIPLYIKQNRRFHAVKPLSLAWCFFKLQELLSLSLVNRKSLQIQLTAKKSVRSCQIYPPRAPRSTSQCRFLHKERLRFFHRC